MQGSPPPTDPGDIATPEQPGRLTPGEAARALAVHGYIDEGDRGDMVIEILDAADALNRQREGGTMIHHMKLAIIDVMAKHGVRDPVRFIADNTPQRDAMRGETGITWDMEPVPYVNPFAQPPPPGDGNGGIDARFGAPIARGAGQRCATCGGRGQDAKSLSHECGDCGARFCARCASMHGK